MARRHRMVVGADGVKRIELAPYRGYEMYKIQFPPDPGERGTWFYEANDPNGDMVDYECDNIREMKQHIAGLIAKQRAANK